MATGDIEDWIVRADVDIIAQTIANMSIDIVAQSIGNLEIDIVAQALSEVINRPTYGGANVSIYNDFAPALSATDIISVLGTGMVYGGYFYIADANDHLNDGLGVVIDGTELFAISPNSLLLWGVKSGMNFPLQLAMYRPDLYQYIVLVKGGLTFESSFKLRYHNILGDSAGVLAQAYYATI